MIELHTKSADDTRDFAGHLAAVVRPGDVLLLSGDLGAGKTTFAQGFGRALGVTERVTSPTFTLMRPYDGPIRVLHADLYRLDDLQEVIDLGIPEFLDEGMVALIEWGDLAEPALPADFLEVRLEFASGDDERQVFLRSSGTSWANRQAAVRRAVEQWVAGGIAP